jgi:AcrR family transcriptional regulator
VRIKDVAERAGLSEGAVYRYFPTVTELYVEVFREVAMRELEVARQAAAVPGPAGTRLEGIIRTHIERALGRPRLSAESDVRQGRHRGRDRTTTDISPRLKPPWPPRRCQAARPHQISGRYTDAEILAEATTTFPNSRVAADFDCIVI